jgi:adenosylcobinamide kinase/adenosylcobinamide-phosphate guanylyltransferase
MAGRIARHRAERGAEAAIELWSPGTPPLAQLIRAESAGRTLLVDSLGTWVAGRLLDEEEQAEHDPHAVSLDLERFTDPLAGALRAARCNVVLVAEETGWGIVPVSAQGRLFRDHLGRLTQTIGRIAERVELVVAGYAIDLRRAGIPVLAPTPP